MERDTDKLQGHQNKGTTASRWVEEEEEEDSQQKKERRSVRCVGMQQCERNAVLGTWAVET